MATPPMCSDKQDLKNALIISEGLQSSSKIHDLRFTEWAMETVNKFKIGDFGNLDAELADVININFNTANGFILGIYLDPFDAEIWIGQSLPYEPVPTMFLPEEY